MPSSRIETLALGNRILHQLLEHLHIDIFELLDVEAALAVRVLAQPGHPLLVRENIRHEIDDDGIFARRKAGDAHVSLMPAVVLVVILAETDDAGSPHDRFFPGHPGHHLHHGFAILATRVIFDGREVAGHADFGWLGLELSHASVPLGWQYNARLDSTRSWSALARPKRALDGGIDSHRLYVECRHGRGIFHNGGMNDAIDELASDPCVKRRHEAEPEAREPRGQHGHRQHAGVQTALARIGTHDIRVAHPVCATDFVDAVVRNGQTQRRHHIVEHVVDGNRLRHHADPAWRNHDRQPLDERADHFEGETSRTDDDGGAKLEHRYARRAQDFAHLMPAAKVRG